MLVLGIILTIAVFVGLVILVVRTARPTNITEPPIVDEYHEDEEC